VININQLNIQYWVDHQLIDILSIDSLMISDGDQIAITGPSGSGKSTLLHSIGGVIKPTSGEISINGTKITSLSQSKRDTFRQDNIGYIFQDFHLIPGLTAEENIKLMLPKMPQKDQQKLIEAWFEKVGLSDRRKHLPSELSRGQQQRVAIIRALIHNPAIVLADEPTGSLDYETASQIMNLLINLCKEQKQTLLCVTHNLSYPKLFTKQIKMESINSVMQKERNDDEFAAAQLEKSNS
jgi:putative ABC transport system ATP-binding protein